jgi:uncharacterized UPF0160 family protein
LHYGKEIISNVIHEIIVKEKNRLTFEPKVDEEIIKMIQEKIYKNLIIYVDANDNGISKI